MVEVLVVVVVLVVVDVTVVVSFDQGARREAEKNAATCKLSQSLEEVTKASQHSIFEKSTSLSPLCQHF